jgi:hypothetical protein
MISSNCEVGSAKFECLKSALALTNTERPFYIRRSSSRFAFFVLRPSLLNIVIRLRSRGYVTLRADAYMEADDGIREHAIWVAGTETRPHWPGRFGQRKDCLAKVELGGSGRTDAGVHALARSLICA